MNAFVLLKTSKNLRFQGVFFCSHNVNSIVTIFGQQSQSRDTQSNVQNNSDCLHTSFKNF